MKRDLLLHLVEQGGGGDWGDWLPAGFGEIFPENELLVSDTPVS